MYEPTTLIEAAKTLGQYLATASQDLDWAATAAKTNQHNSDYHVAALVRAARHTAFLDLLNAMPFDVQTIARRRSAEILNPSPTFDETVDKLLERTEKAAKAAKAAKTVTPRAPRADTNPKRAARAYHKALTKFAKDTGYDPDVDVRLITDKADIKRFTDSDAPVAIVIFEVGSIDLIPEGVDTEFGYIEFTLPTFAGVLVENQNSYTLAFYAD